MAICSQVEPPEVVFADGVRVACHLYPPGTGEGRLITAAEVAARAATTATPAVRPVGAATGETVLPAIPGAGA
jgi:hypothetical protein